MKFCEKTNSINRFRFFFCFVVRFFRFSSLIFISNSIINKENEETDSFLSLKFASRLEKSSDQRSSEENEQKRNRDWHRHEERTRQSNVRLRCAQTQSEKDDRDGRVVNSGFDANRNHLSSVSNENPREDGATKTTQPRQKTTSDDRFQFDQSEHVTIDVNWTRWKQTRKLVFLSRLERKLTAEC